MSKIKHGWIRHQEVSETLQRLNVTLQQQCLSFPLIGHFEQTFPFKKNRIFPAETQTKADRCSRTASGKKQQIN